MPDITTSAGQLISSPESRSQTFSNLGQSEKPATKIFTVNATGNLFIASTLDGDNDGSSNLSAEATQAFEEVSVFFAALTKAMAKQGKGVFDYESLKQIVSESGQFIQVTETDIDFKSSSWGVTFGNDLIKAVLGAGGGLTVIAKSLMEMITGIGAAAGSIEVSGGSESDKSRLGTIIFVCEYLLGAVSITPVLVSVDAESAKKAFKAGPCLKTNKVAVEMKIRKSVYLFVPPAFVTRAASLNSAMHDSSFNQLVETLEESLIKSAE